MGMEEPGFLRPQSEKMDSSFFSIQRQGDGSNARALANLNRGAVGSAVFIRMEGGGPRAQYRNHEHKKRL